jgi:hypothetical protein
VQPAVQTIRTRGRNTNGMRPLVHFYRQNPRSGQLERRRNRPVPSHCRHSWCRSSECNRSLEAWGHPLDARCPNHHRPSRPRPERVLAGSAAAAVDCSPRRSSSGLCAATLCRAWRRGRRGGPRRAGAEERVEEVGAADPRCRLAAGGHSVGARKLCGGVEESGEG